MNCMAFVSHVQLSELHGLCFACTIICLETPFYWCTLFMLCHRMTGLHVLNTVTACFDCAVYGFRSITTYLNKPIFIFLTLH